MLASDLANPALDGHVPADEIVLQDIIKWAVQDHGHLRPDFVQSVGNIKVSFAYYYQDE